jgi:hypothetical protein
MSDIFGTIKEVVPFNNAVNLKSISDLQYQSPKPSVVAVNQEPVEDGVSKHFDIVGDVCPSCGKFNPDTLTISRN